jgi:hypothetical protein
MKSSSFERGVRFSGVGVLDDDLLSEPEHVSGGRVKRAVEAV